MMTTNLFVIANVKQLWTGGNFRILLHFFQTSCGFGFLSSASFNSFYNRVEFGTILEWLWNFGGVEPPKPLPHPRYATITNSKLVGQWEGMKAHVEGTKSRFSPIKHSSGKSLTLNCYLFLSEDQACMYTCTSTWVAFSKTCVIAVNIRNLVYYKIYEISHCP